MTSPRVIYKGDAACAGCGISGSERPRRRKDEVCSECFRFLQLGRKVKADTERYGEVQFGSSVKGLFTDSRKNRETTGQLYYLSPHKSENGNSEQLDNAMRDFLKTLDKGDKKNYGFEVGTFDLHHRSSYTVSAETAEQFFDWFKILVEYARNVYEEGYRDGQNLIVGLAKGEVSLEKFNEAAIKNK